MIKKFDHGVVGNEEINVPVAIVVRESDAEPFAGLGETDFLGNLGEVAVTVVVVDQRRNGLKNVRMTIGAVALFVFAAPDVVEIPLKIAENHEVQQAIIV